MARIQHLLSTLCAGLLVTSAAPQSSTSVAPEFAQPAESQASFGVLTSLAHPPPGSIHLAPPLSAASIYESVLALAAGGNGPALAWCARHLAQAPADLIDDPAFGAGLFRELVVRHSEAPWLTKPRLEPLRSLDAAPEAVRTQVEVELRQVPQGSAAEPLALFLRSAAIAPRAGAHNARTERAMELVRELRERYPEHPLVERAEDFSWRLQHVAPGLAAPELGLRDVDGNELVLSDFAGKTVLIDVWRLDDSDLRARIARRRATFERFGSQPFVVLGIGMAGDEEAFRIDLEELDLAWSTSFEGSLEGPAARAWHLDGTPTTFLIDAQGTVRATRLDGQPLDDAIDSLLRAPAGNPAPAAPTAEGELGRAER